MKTATTYDTIGAGYGSQRQPDPEWERRILEELGDFDSLVNIGAGTGSYEPQFRNVIAVEPSVTMINQRTPQAAPCIRAVSEQLPFRDQMFDVALAVLSVHHWDDPEAGLAEMKRVAKRQVVVTWDPNVFATNFWLVRDYLPEAHLREQSLATLDTVKLHLNTVSTTELSVTSDCRDGVFGAYWKRPEAYLDPLVRKAISGLALLNPEIVDRGIRKLELDVASGFWYQRYSELLPLDVLDLGYRVVVAK